MYATIGVHDPVPEDIEIQHYETDGEARIRVRLTGPSSDGFGGIAIHAGVNEMASFAATLLAKVLGQAATVQIDADGDWVMDQSLVEPKAPCSRFRHHDPTQTVEITQDFMPDPMSPPHLDLQVATGRQNIKVTDESAPFEGMKPGQVTTVHALGWKPMVVKVQSVSEDGAMISGEIIGGQEG